MAEHFQRQRDEAVDILKGVSILAIMLLHYENGLFPDWLNAWIGSFMISAFYFSSGWVLGTKPDLTFRELLRKRWHSIAIPYLWFSALLIAVSIVLWGLGHYDFRIVLRDIYKTITLRGIGTLWFLPAIFGGEIIAWKFRNSGLFGRVLLCVGTILFGLLYNYWSTYLGHLSDIWRILDSPLRTVNNIVNAWFVVVAGYYLGKFYSDELSGMHIRKKIILALTVLCWYSLALQGRASGTDCFIQLLGPFGLFILCKLAVSISVFQGIAWFGKNSLIVMATHYSILQELCILINRQWGTGTEYLEGWTALGYLAVSVLLEIPIIWLINSKYPFLLGKIRR